MRPLFDRFTRLGIQKRIMLYVTLGLAITFGGFVFIGFRSINRATGFVYVERLNTAQTTAGIMERDFLHLSRDVTERSDRWSGDQSSLDETAGTLFEHLSETDPFPFFMVTGVWVLDREGKILGHAGNPAPRSELPYGALVPAADEGPEDAFRVLSAVGGAVAGVPFACIVTPAMGAQDSRGIYVAVHTVSVNSSLPFSPAAYWRPGADPSGIDGRDDNSQGTYHLEVVDRQGIAVLGIGEDEHPGQPSSHFAIIRSVIEDRKTATLVHNGGPGDRFTPHVMAVVPLPSSDFSLILEQPVDVALGLPNQLRQQVILLTILGFGAAMLVAWVTTRHVVKPTEKLTQAAERIAAGDLESPITVRAQDEVGKLTESLESMRKKLQEAHRQVADTNTRLESQVRDRTARLGELLNKIISAQEEERYRLARELHDETAQTLGALTIALDRARDGLRGAPSQAIQQISEAKEIATRLLEETRRLILDLRPLVLDDLGLQPAIRWYVESHLERPGMTATVAVEQPAVRLPKPIEVALFRIIQEAVNNIARHSAANRAQIHLGFNGGRANLRINDDGKGFDAERLLGPDAPVTSTGLLGMQERVKLLNGTINIKSQVGRGTEILVDVPIR